MAYRLRTTTLTTLALLLVVSAGAAAPTAVFGAPGANARLLDRLDGRPRVARNARTGAVSYLGGSVRRPIASRTVLGRPVSAAAAARRFVDRFGPLFGAADAARELRSGRIVRAPHGRTFVRYQQSYRGLPVIGGEIVVQVSRGLDVVSASGEASTRRPDATTPRITAGRAARIARAAVAARKRVPAWTLRASRPTLAILDRELTENPRALPVATLVWQVDINDTRGMVDAFVAVDALHGPVAATFDRVLTADPPANAIQRICNLKNNPAGAADGALQCDPGDAKLVLDPASSSVADVASAYLATESTYDFFARRFGRRSIDGTGGTIISTVRYCPPTGCPFPNAAWNGLQVVYGSGFALADDVVAHELTHGVTEHTSGLFYWFQSGAISEALSDIFGELVDQTNGLGTDTAEVKWLMGEDIPSIAPLRDMEDPTQFGDPDRMGSPDYTSDPSFADLGGVHSNSGVANKAAFLMTDGGSFNGHTVTGLGIDKSAAIWYRVAAYLLSSGSDYSDLASALHQACTDLLDSTPRDGTGSPSSDGPISAADCDQVDAAVAATEMRQDPPEGVIPRADLCAAGTPKTTPFLDRITASATGWVTNAPARFRVGDLYATSPRYSLWVLDRGARTSWYRRTRRITMPATGPIYLSFRHYVDIEWRFDGGIVEYTTNASGASGWKDLKVQFVANGYDATLFSGTGNPLAGRRAFTGFSFGFQTSIADLTFLKGKRVYLRFRFGDDDFSAAQAYGLYGWMIDDVRVYRCTGPDAAGPVIGGPSVDLAKGTLEADGTPVPLVASWSAADAGGIDGTSLQRRVGAGSFLDVPLPGRAALSVTTTVPATTSVQTFKAGARDGVGNRSTAALTTTVQVIDEVGDTPTVTYTGTWTSESNAGSWGGSVAYAAAAGTKASVLVDGVTDLAWVTTKGPDRGKADVYVDGVRKATIDLYAPSLQRRQVVYTVSFGGPGTHRLGVVATGTKQAASSGKRVDIDAFEAIGDGP